MPYIQVIPVIDAKVRGMCKLEYPGHKNGCPNWNRNDRCPPKAPMISDVLDLNRSVFAIYNVFNLVGHVEKMKVKHSEWSDRQLYCCLYWQGSARKALKEEIKSFMLLHPDMIIADTPEAMGVNLTETMKSVGIVLEWPPKNIAYQVVLAGFSVERF
jgi:predicted metal-binding protein